MREVLFRVRDNKRWYYGLPLHISETNVQFEGVDENGGRIYSLLNEKDTLGQFTGLTDKNGKKIFEGDIVKWYAELLIIKYGEHDVVEESNEYGNHFRNVKKFGWYGERVKDMPSTGIDLKTLAVGEVVGNIYDNPGVLEDRQ